ncbi:hypothetical protein BO78DRAFT_453601 [Aspergillus sclerotiicarbonarius CBS 121057]|uniref:GH16 domain-containing protein n=1 Tax=Aspergillus sclerotiicarbonarius (strain CBS 121057 / IBT 28362) TaxID=1448318 RepID=A0A319DXI0_ASPSB|nr:hypothetical protein BO78DRAFT_453601 [Aspergillus sclerotiicarbonarius CBS 121057]
MWYHPYSWSPRTKLASATILFTVVLIIIIATPKRGYPYPTPPNPIYTLVDTYTGPSFFDKFTYFTEEDPTDGFVEYINPTLLSTTTTNNNNPQSQPQSQPQSKHHPHPLNLTHATHSSITLRIDSNRNSNSNSKIKSIRIESLPRYNTGLFIFDIRHTPHGCGLWPALWLSDASENWPDNGEIDVLEATNRGDAGNVVSLHTGRGCFMPGDGDGRVQTGIVTGNENGVCDVGIAKGNVMGCGVRGGVETFGSVFNEGGGGVYALEIHPSGIKVWFFPRGDIPADILTTITTSTTTTTTRDNTPPPNPKKWGLPLAHFPNTHCPITTHFKNLQIIANIDICGQNAGHPTTYTAQDGCPGTTCEDYVRENLQEVGQEAYWEFGGFWVFQAIAGGTN